MSSLNTAALPFSSKYIYNYERALLSSHTTVMLVGVKFYPTNQEERSNRKPNKQSS
jgi:hypothetical protein